MSTPIFTGGLASGIDSSLIIDKLVELRSKSITLTQDRQDALTAQISALGALSSRLAALGDMAKSLATGGVRAVKISSTNTAFSAAVTSGADAGRHQISVERLATAARLRSTGLGASDAIRAGKLHLEMEGRAFDVKIEEGATLADVAKAIDASGAPVSATVLNDGTRSYLSITNRETGHPIGAADDSALVITQTFTGTTGAALFGDPPADDPTAAVTVRGSAVNARLTIDGLPVERASNEIADLLPGVTMTLRQPSATGTSEDLVLADHRDGTRSKLDSFVAAYNSIATALKALTAPADGSVGTLSGDSAVRSLQSDLQALLTHVLPGGGSVRSLGDAGLALQRDGTLKVDDKLFAAALDENPDALDTLFATKGDGIADQLQKLVDRYTGTKGIFTDRKDGLDATVKRLDTDLTSQKEHLKAFRQNLVRQFTALEETVSKYNAIGQFLDQQDKAREKK